MLSCNLSLQKNPKRPTLTVQGVLLFPTWKCDPNTSRRGAKPYFYISGGEVDG